MSINIDSLGRKERPMSSQFQRYPDSTTSILLIAVVDVINKKLDSLADLQLIAFNGYLLLLIEVKPFSSITA